MKKINAYIVDDGIYWADYSVQDAYESYKAFSLKEANFYEDPGIDFPLELSQADLENIKLENCGDKTLADLFSKTKKPGLIHCDIF